MGKWDYPTCRRTCTGIYPFTDTHFSSKKKKFSNPPIWIPMGTVKIDIPSIKANFRGQASS